MYLAAITQLVYNTAVYNKQSVAITLVLAGFTGGLYDKCLVYSYNCPEITNHRAMGTRHSRNCGTKAADVPAKFSSWKTSCKSTDYLDAF